MGMRTGYYNSDASISRLRTVKTIFHHRVDSGICGVRVAQRRSGIGRSLRAPVGEQAGQLYESENTRGRTLRPPPELRIQLWTQATRRRPSRAGAFRYGLAPGNIEADAFSPERWKAVGTRRARHEIGHRVFSVRDSDIAGVGCARNAAHSVTGQFR